MVKVWEEDRKILPDFNHSFKGSKLKNIERQYNLKEQIKYG